jgi:hypothetical protein
MSGSECEVTRQLQRSQRLGQVVIYEKKIGTLVVSSLCLTPVTQKMLVLLAKELALDTENRDASGLGYYSLP